MRRSSADQADVGDEVIRLVEAGRAGFAVVSGQEGRLGVRVVVDRFLRLAADQTQERTRYRCQYQDAPDV